MTLSVTVLSAKCRYTECRYAEYQYAKCRYAECHGAHFLDNIFKKSYELLKSIRTATAPYDERDDGNMDWFVVVKEPPVVSLVVRWS